MQINNKFLDDLARVATGAAGVIAEAGQRLQQQWRENGPVGGGEGSLSAEEIEAVRIMAAKAREAQAQLEARVAALEADVARLTARLDPAAAGEKGNGKSKAKGKSKGAGKTGGVSKTGGGNRRGGG